MFQLIRFIHFPYHYHLVDSFNFSLHYFSYGANNFSFSTNSYQLAALFVHKAGHNFGEYLNLFLPLVMNMRWINAYKVILFLNGLILRLITPSHFGKSQHQLEHHQQQQQPPPPGRSRNSICHRSNLDSAFVKCQWWYKNKGQYQLQLSLQRWRWIIPSQWLLRWIQILRATMQVLLRPLPLSSISSRPNRKMGRYRWTRSKEERR